MKHILKFVLQTLVVLFYYTPIIVGRYIWTLKWNDKVNGLPNGIYHTYKKVCWRNFKYNVGITTYPQNKRPKPVHF